MSKNLEREYRALVNSEVPDLWTRIEAGLEEKTAPDRSDLSDSGISDIGSHDRRVSFKIWAGLAAACACAVLIVPAMVTTMRMGRSGSGNTASNNTAYDNAAPQAAETGQGEAYENSADEAAAENSGGVNSAVTADGLYVSADSETDDVDGFAAEAAEAEQDWQCFAATVEILDADVRRDSGILYTAKVIATEYPGISVDSEIRIFSPAAEGVTVLENAQMYDLTLREGGSDDEETEYELLGTVK